MTLQRWLALATGCAKATGGWLRLSDETNPMCPPDADPLRPRDISRLSGEYALAASEVLIDARLVERWQAPEAELRAELSRRHDWPADRAARYLADVRRALRQQT